MNRGRMLTPTAFVMAAILGFAVVTLVSCQRRTAGRNTGPQKTVVEESASSAKVNPEGKPVAESKPAAEKGKPTDQPDKPDAVAKKPVQQRKSSDPEQPQRRAPGSDGPGFARHDYAMQLMRMVLGISEIEKSEKHALKPEQAKQILAILTPLRSKPKLTDEEAQQALRKLKKVFTADQLNAMTRMMPGPRPGQRPDHGSQPPGQWHTGTGGPPGGPSGGPGGHPPGAPPGAPGQPRTGPRFDPDAMKDFNPFYTKAPEGNERAKERIKRMDEFFASLEKRAASK